VIEIIVGIASALIVVLFTAFVSLFIFGAECQIALILICIGLLCARRKNGDSLPRGVRIAAGAVLALGAALVLLFASGFDPVGCN
jgi:hypothetical protein